MVIPDLLISCALTIASLFSLDSHICILSSLPPLRVSLPLSYFILLLLSVFSYAFFTSFLAFLLPSSAGFRIVSGVPPHCHLGFSSDISPSFLSLLSFLSFLSFLSDTLHLLHLVSREFLVPPGLSNSSISLIP